MRMRLDHETQEFSDLKVMDLRTRISGSWISGLGSQGHGPHGSQVMDLMVLRSWISGSGISGSGPRAGAGPRAEAWPGQRHGLVYMAWYTWPGIHGPVHPPRVPHLATPRVHPYPPTAAGYPCTAWSGSKSVLWALKGEGVLLEWHLNSI